MAIKAYVGIMGSGKTYEVVTQVILRALRQGRRVVSNIAGLNHEAMVQLLMEEGCTTVGELVRVEHAEIRKPDFWLTDTGEPAFIKPGDLVALDEVWRFWDGLGLSDDDGKRPKQFMNFVRMHRQFVHPETGITCDLAIITQDVMDIHRSVRSVIEETYRFEKMTIVGQPDRYRIDVFKRGRTAGKPIRQLPGHYEEKYFGLYKSHSQSAGTVDPRELNADDRGNVLKGAFFKFVVPLAIPLFIGGAWLAWSAFQSKTPVQVQQQAGKATGKTAAAVVAKSEPEKSASSVQLRVIGAYSVGGLVRYMVTDGAYVRYITAPHAVKVWPMTTELLMPDGSFAASWAVTAKQRESKK